METQNVEETENIKGKRIKITSEIATEMRDEYNNKNISSMELSKKYNITREYVNTIVANKSHYNKNYIRTRKAKKITLEVAKVMRHEYNNKHMATSELAKKYSIGETYVIEIIANRRYHDEKYVKTRCERGIKITTEIAKQIRKEYNEGLLSFFNIRKKYDVCDNTVLKVITNKIRVDPEYKRTKFTY